MRPVRLAVVVVIVLTVMFLSVYPYALLILGMLKPCPLLARDCAIGFGFFFHCLQMILAFI
jgi:hypothetical protein